MSGTKEDGMARVDDFGTLAIISYVGFQLPSYDPVRPWKCFVILLSAWLYVQVKVFEKLREI